MNAQDKHFGFGKNWSAFLAVVGETQIAEAERSLREMLESESLAGRSFLDIGSGSGLFSLAAARLGAEKVHSFDYDPHSVNCAREIKRRYMPDAKHWIIELGSVLDAEYVSSLEGYDIVYSWGVLHHTGNMRQALENAVIPLKPGGVLFIAIYNDQGRESRFWHGVKRAYNTLPVFLRFLITIPTLLWFWTPKSMGDLLRGKPFSSWKNYKQRRGMSAWHDVVDWAGGYPFEVAKPEQIFDFYHTRGFQLRRLRTVGGQSGCNEFVFQHHG